MQDTATSRNSTRIRAVSSVNFREERRERNIERKKVRFLFILFLLSEREREREPYLAEKDFCDPF